MSREDVRKNLVSWEADSVAYQERNASQLNRWDRLGWGTWDIPEDEVRALGDVVGLRALELGCGACQTGIKVAMRGANVIGIDFSANQLRQGVANIAETGVRFPLVRASAEELPFADASFDLVFCDHGATSFTDPNVTIPEAARVLRPGGMLVFDMATPYIWTAWGDDDEPASRTLRRPYFSMGREELPDPENGPSVEWQLTYGEWIRLFRSSGFVVEDLIELRAPEGATTTYSTYAPLDWARDFPGEHIWKVRKS
ncbi:MAG: class I SAM-dependent methyltransferase [Actinomycetota bacterium]|nr:class I SAM-dependent methyltransferase [Actinomycetota bacterium]